MRFAAGQLVEILSVEQREGYGYGVVRKTIDGESRDYEIGLDREAWLAFHRILSLRPFSDLPGINHRYFFIPGCGRSETGPGIEMMFRVDVGGAEKQFAVRGPKSLLANLLWLSDLHEWSGVAHLRRV